MEKLKILNEVCEICSEKALQVRPKASQLISANATVLTSWPTQSALKSNNVGSKIFDWLRPIGAKSVLPNLTMRTKLYEVPFSPQRRALTLDLTPDPAHQQDARGRRRLAEEPPRQAAQLTR